MRTGVSIPRGAAADSSTSIATRAGLSICSTFTALIASSATASVRPPRA